MLFNIIQITPARLQMILDIMPETILFAWLAEERDRERISTERDREAESMS